MADNESLMRSRLIMGFVDSSLASLGTFAVGLYATRYLSPDQLGAYALFFGAFLLIIMVPAELIFRPAEVVTVGYSPDERLGVLRSSLSIGAAPSVAVAIVFAGLALVVPADIGFGASVAFAVTTAVAGLLSPAQDHVRRMLHQAERSSLAASVSAVQLVTVLAVLLIMEGSGVAREWIPMGALAAANCASILYGLVAARWAGHRGVIELEAAQLVRTGGWLVTSGFALVGGQVASIVLIILMAGSAEAGFAQAALILAQPLFVVANGLGSVLNPRIMEAAGRGDEPESRQVSRSYSMLMLGATAALALVIGIEWPGSPMPDLFPNAYAANGLLVLTIVAQGLNYTLFGKQFELIGGRAHVDMAKATVTASIAQGTTGALAGLFREYTAALGIAVAVVAKAGLFRRALARMYSARLDG